MDREEVRQKLRRVFVQVFDQEIELRDDLSAPDVEGWDSLAHVTLIVTVEKAFGIRFTGSEIASGNNVGDMIDQIVAKTG